MSNDSNDTTIGQIKHLLDLLSKAPGGADAYFMRRLFDGPFTDLLEGLGDDYSIQRDDLRIALGLLPKNPTVIVDKSLSLEEMIGAGNYSSIKHDLYTGSFLREWLEENPDSCEAGDGRVTASVHLEKIMHSADLAKNDAEKWSDPHYRLANYDELLAFGATFPKLVIRHDHIYGKSYPGPKSSPAKRFHPCLWSHSGKRGLNLQSRGDFANRGTAFLFVKKQK